MSNALFFDARLAPDRPEEQDRVKAKPPVPGPVLLGDCATAADHTTLLLALWRRWDADRSED